VELYEEGMVYRITADALIVFHLLWIFWLIFGPLVAYRHPWLRALHLAGLVFSVTMQVYGWYCPLTHLEQWLRYQQAPDASYTGSFITHYAERVIYLDVSPYLVLVLTLLICAGTTYIYLTWRPPTAKRGPKRA
jgi:hypothetical protein